MFVDTSVRPQGEQVDAVAPSKMKLSAAIRIGARLRPQGRGQAFSDGKSCVWGAAWEGSGHPYEEGYSYFQILCSAEEWMEANQSMREAHGNGMAVLNDSGATREQIADWLEAQGL